MRLNGYHIIDFISKNCNIKKDIIATEHLRCSKFILHRKDEPFSRIDPEEWYKELFDFEYKGSVVSTKKKNKTIFFKDFINFVKRFSLENLETVVPYFEKEAMYETVIIEIINKATVFANEDVSAKQLVEIFNQIAKDTNVLDFLEGTTGFVYDENLIKRIEDFLKNIEVNIIERCKKYYSEHYMYRKICGFHSVFSEFCIRLASYLEFVSKRTEVKDVCLFEFLYKDPIGYVFKQAYTLYNEIVGDTNQPPITTQQTVEYDPVASFNEKLLLTYMNDGVL